MLLSEIKRLCHQGAIRWTNHVFLRMVNRGIQSENIEEGILSGEIIEDYPDDYPHPSCLILGFSNGKPIHIVCGSNGEELWIITAYFPNPEKWSSDFKERKEN